jgi:hypothetical protein
MKEVVISIILALIPLISFYFQYYFSKKHNFHHIFKKNPACFYFDWLFILFNFFLIYTIDFNFQKLFILFFVSLVGNLFFHIEWAKIHIKEKKEAHMFDIKNKKITKAGIVHFLFSFIETILIGLFILSFSKSIFVYLELSILFFFLIGLLYSSKKVYGRVIPIELALVLVSFAMFLYKLYYILRIR